MELDTEPMAKGSVQKLLHITQANALLLEPLSASVLNVEDGKKKNTWSPSPTDAHHESEVMPRRARQKTFTTVGIRTRM